MSHDTLLSLNKRMDAQVYDRVGAFGRRIVPVAVSSCNE